LLLALVSHILIWILEMRFPFMLSPERLVTLAAFLVCCVFSSHAQVRVVDDLHRTVTLPHAATRIVSLAPSITESLFAIGAGNQVVGVTDYCNYPADAQTRRHVGGMTNPNIESIVGLSPDLIVVSMEGNLRQDFTALTATGVPVFVSNPRTIRAINESLRQLGVLTGHQTDAMSLADSLSKSATRLLSAVKDRRTRTLLLVSVQPLMAVGTKNFLNEMLQAAGGQNLAAPIGLTYPTLSRETILQQNPDVILITSDACDSTANISALYPEWTQISAVRNKRVYRIDADLVARPGPRAIEGLALLTSYLHTGHQ
jgi:iron complex transport system substrate-binding protein